MKSRQRTLLTPVIDLASNSSNRSAFRSMAAPRLSLAPDAESIAANRRRERLLVRGGASLILLALASTALACLFQPSQGFELLVAIFVVTCLGLAVFAFAAVAWRRICAGRGHSFNETDIFPDGSVMVYQCRHCGERRYVTRESTPGA
jgi:hypothetical protein